MPGTWDKDQVFIFYYTAAISWNFIVDFIKHSLILVFQKSNVFSQALKISDGKHLPILASSYKIMPWKHFYFLIIITKGKKF